MSDCREWDLGDPVRASVLFGGGRAPEGGDPPEVGVAMLLTTPAGLDGGRGS